MSKKKEYVTAYGFLKSNGVSYFTMGKENSEKLLSFLKEKALSEQDLVFLQSTTKIPFAIGALTGIGSVMRKAFNLVVLGDFYSSNGAYQGTRFTCEEYMEDAKVLHEKMAMENKRAQDYYYNNYCGS